MPPIPLPVADERVIEFLKTRRNVKAWIEEVLKVVLKGEDLHEALKTGIVLCYLMNEIDDSMMPIHEGTTHAFKLRENISSFLLALEDYGIPSHKMFMQNDLWEGTNMVTVIECIAELGRVANSRDFPIRFKSPDQYNGPKLSLPPPDELADLKRKISQLKDKPKGAVKVKMSAHIMRIQLQVTAQKEVDWPKLEGRVTRFQSLIRRFQSRKKYQKIVRDVSYRAHVAKEILSTEQLYVKSLEIIIRVFLNPLTEVSLKPKSFVTKEDLKVIFSDIVIIESINRQLLNDIENRIKNWSMHTLLGDVFLHFVAHFKVYTGYLQNYNESLSRINLLSKNEKFAKLILECKKDPECQQLDLPSFLIKPVQRIPRYSLLLKDLTKHTWKDHPDYLTLEKSVEEMEKLGTYLNHQKRIAENAIKLLEIVQHIYKAPAHINLMESSRRFIREAQLSDQKTVVYLFNDMLLLGTGKKKLKAGQPKQVKYQDSFPLLEVTVNSLGDDKNVPAIEIIRPSKKPVKLQFSSNPDKLIWIKDINALKDELLNITSSKQKQITAREIISTGVGAEELLQKRHHEKTQSRLSVPDLANNSPKDREKLLELKENLEAQATTLRMKTTVTGPIQDILARIEAEIKSIQSQIDQLPIDPPIQKNQTLGAKGMARAVSVRMPRTNTVSPATAVASGLLSPTRSNANVTSSLGSHFNPPNEKEKEKEKEKVVEKPPLVRGHSVSGVALSKLAAPSSPTVTPSRNAPSPPVPASAPESLDGSDGISIEELRTQIKNGTDSSSNIENLLSSAEFFKAFQMTKEEFAKLIKWKQERMKKQVLGV
eukprot:TRINITY_DN17353_c0_g1_i1.p1 TRINITY_DN17353_c0_g1~~TRINITY_DN17353_c0_g1_i1.p1  ORF type:complete len:823 (+),score=196.91 TRINITY_DN17353_c0_g1_i1:5-2473(+)